MSDTNLNDASFTPEIQDSEESTNKQTYSATGSFRFWCQKVLPLVYDDSLSYYELLCKVVNYLNNVIQNVDNLNTSVDNTNTAFNNLQNYVNTTKDTLVEVYGELEQYVNDYFNNLDVQEEINSKLDSMAEDGSLSTIISPFIPTAVSEWLSHNITPTSPAIDASLSVSGAGADAKVTGDRLSELNERLGYKDIYVYFSYGDYATWEKKTDGFYLTLPTNRDLIIFYGKNGRKTVSVSDILTMAREYGLTVNGTTIFGNVVILLFNIQTATVYFSNAVGENDYVLYYAYWGSAVFGKICDNYYYLAPLKEQIEASRNTWYAYTPYGKKWTWNKNDGKCHLYIPNGNVTIRGVGIPTYITVNYSDIMNALSEYTDVTINNGYVDGYEFSIVYDTETSTVKVHANSHYESSEIILFAHHWESANYGLLTYDDPGNDGLRNYWLEHIDNKIETINSNTGDAGIDGTSFMFISDIHIENNDGQSPRLMKEITDRTSLKYLILNGDYINQNTNKQIEIDNLRNTINTFRKSVDICFPATGNHDKNTNFASDVYQQYELTDAEVFDCVQSHLPYGVEYGNPFYFYYDDTITKTRFIIMQSGFEHYTWAGQITQEQLTWVRNIMDNTPNGYHIVVFVHAIYQPSDWSQLTPVFNPEYLTGPGAALFNEIDGHNTGHPNSPVVALFSGHIHLDMSTTTDGGVPVIFIDCDARNTNAGNYQAETINSQCFDVITINYTNKTIKCVRIGRGSDRTFTY